MGDEEKVSWYVVKLWYNENDAGAEGASGPYSTEAEAIDMMEILENNNRDGNIGFTVVEQIFQDK